MSIIENRSSAWHAAVVPFECPYCSKLVGADNFEHADRHGFTLRLICWGCHKEILVIEMVRGDRDDDE
jgi:hypothetical protein